MKKVMIALMMAGGLFVLGAGCGGEKSGTDAKDTKGTTAAGDKIGVAECDDYFTKLDACMGKMPAAGKAAFEQSRKQNHDAWKQAASTPQGKEGLKTGCKAALDALAQNPSCK
jgi:hypothetical protein